MGIVILAFAMFCTTGRGLCVFMMMIGIAVSWILLIKHQPEVDSVSNSMNTSVNPPLVKTKKVGSQAEPAQILRTKKINYQFIKNQLINQSNDDLISNDEVETDLPLGKTNIFGTIIYRKYFMQLLTYFSIFFIFAFYSLNDIYSSYWKRPLDDKVDANAIYGLLFLCAVTGLFSMVFHTHLFWANFALNTALLGIYVWRFMVTFEKDPQEKDLSGEPNLSEGNQSKKIILKTQSLYGPGKSSSKQKSQKSQKPDEPGCLAFCLACLTGSFAVIETGFCCMQWCLVCIGRKANGEAVDGCDIKTNVCTVMGSSLATCLPCAEFIDLAKQHKLKFN